jgi:hypothetical protein
MGQKGILSRRVISVDHSTIRHSHTLNSPTPTLAMVHQLTYFIYAIHPNLLCSKDY